MLIRTTNWANSAVHEPKTIIQSCSLLPNRFSISLKQDILKNVKPIKENLASVVAKQLSLTFRFSRHRLRPRSRPMHGLKVRRVKNAGCLSSLIIQWRRVMALYCRGIIYYSHFCSLCTLSDHRSMRQIKDMFSSRLLWCWLDNTLFDLFVNDAMVLLLWIWITF